ncbi:hypothetical protein [Streptomyces hokutonensis]|uniref:Uncharacterized protein n=1 Tax=Streptomyces hokutonensis TaxID=1306990 RepID=A0ABW6M8A7_9ACTN
MGSRTVRPQSQRKEAHITSSKPDYYEYEGSRKVPRWLPKKAPTPAVAVQPEPYVQPPDSGVSVRAATEALQASPDFDRFTEVYEHTVADGHGAFAQMHQFLESAANWCHDRGALDSAGELTSWTTRLEELIEDAQLLPESLVIESAAVSRNERQEQAARPPSPTASTTKPAPVLPADGPRAGAAAPVAVRRR